MGKFCALKILFCFFTCYFINTSKAEPSCTSPNGYTDISCKAANAFCCGKLRTQCCSPGSSVQSHLLIGGAMLLIALPMVMSGWCFPFFPCCCWFGGSGHSSLDSSSSSSSDSSNGFSGGSSSD